MSGLPERLRTAGVRHGQRAVVRMAQRLRDEAAALAPGRLGAALRAEETAEGAQVHMPHYAKFLEFGTRKMAARPFLRPAIERVRAWLRTGRPWE